MIDSDLKASNHSSTVTTHPYFGAAGVLLGTMIAACTGRLLKVGLADQVRQQAFTLATSGNFLLVAARCVACIVVVAFMSTVPTQYRRVVAPPVEAK